MSKFSLLSLIFITLFARGAYAKTVSLYNCDSARPEEAGQHNMVLFGRPDDILYAYHLPLFTGELNGNQGHVLMHVYQALWNVSLDAITKDAYDDKFREKSTASDSIPFFTLGPSDAITFKVPEMICNDTFSMVATVVYGHIEGNRNFPQPEEFTPHRVSTVTRVGPTIFARRFDGTAKDQLCYFVFGTAKQLYLAHYLTDNESSFDQIVAIESDSQELKNLVATQKTLQVTVQNSPENGLLAIPEFVRNSSPNNKLKLSVNPLNKVITVDSPSFSSGSAQVKIIDDIYFNNDRDLRKKRQ